MKKIFFFFSALVLTYSCNTQKAITIAEPAPIEVEERLLDTLVVSAPAGGDETEEEDIFTLPVYRHTAKREHDLLHTKLDLRFDWANEKVLGKATLTLLPYFYPTDKVTLDAKGFEFHQIRFDGQPSPLKYEYDGRQVTIDLDKIYTKNDTFRLFIDYTASPAETGGSAAITSDQGLFFINPRGEEGGKPQQIWTQGETEWNSRWFPTIDKPNERCTQEIYLTVEDRFKTLSNGLLTASTKNPDGTRTDYWKMDQPHAPYLFMIAVGEYAVVRDEWQGLPVEYYVEPEYEADARNIFANTVEMLGFFSQKLGVKYPWPKFSQVVVRDYVSGAMENTTAVIYGEFVQRPTRELIDNTNEKIVAHEMFHHWFGDYVTCESWANLTLNEGFANYSEYLWLEHQYGRDEADFHLLNEWNGYIGSSRNDIHPLIHFGFDDKEEMFDAHSYNKGGAVLHMLRQTVGDEAFFTALNLYLKEHAYRPAEVHDLRLAFESVTGEDLNWFFNQWYLQPGHPILNVTYSYDEPSKTASITVEQTQYPEEMPAVFILPAAVDIYTGEKKLRENITVNERKQTFTFEVEEKPSLMLFDADRYLLCESQDNKTQDELAFQFFNAPKFYYRYEALQRLMNSDHPKAEAVLTKALQDESWVMRELAISGIDDSTDPKLRAALLQLAEKDQHSSVRALALEKLAELGDNSAIGVAKRAIEKDPAYNVNAAGLAYLIQFDKPAALEFASKLENEKNGFLLDAIGDLYVESGNIQYLAFFEKNLSNLDGFSAISFYSSYQAMASKADFDTALQAMENLKAIGTNMGQSPWRRFAAAKSINDMRNEYRSKANGIKDPSGKEEWEARVDQLTSMLEEIKAKETNSQLKSLYEQLTLINRV